MNGLPLLTDKVATRKGAWLTLIIWLVLIIGLSFGPKLNDYKVTNFQSLPDDAHSIITQKKLDELFPEDKGTPGIYVFHKEDEAIVIEDIFEIIERIKNEHIAGIEEIVDLSQLPPLALEAFLSEDKTTMIVPMNLEA